MSGKKGMKHYGAAFKADVVHKYRQGVSVHALSRKYGVSRYAIQCWCGLRKEYDPLLPKQKRGRPRVRPIAQYGEMEQRIKQLEMEVELYKSFLQAAGRM